jgi:hypothetical protein
MLDAVLFVGLGFLGVGALLVYFLYEVYRELDKD